MKMVHSLLSWLRGETAGQTQSEIDAAIERLKKIRAEGDVRINEMREASNDVLNAARRSSTRLEVPTGP